MNEKNIIRYYIYTEEFKTHNLANYYFTYRLFKNNFKEDYKIVKNVGQVINQYFFFQAIILINSKNTL